MRAGDLNPRPPAPKSNAKTTRPRGPRYLVDLNIGDLNNRNICIPYFYLSSIQMPSPYNSYQAAEWSVIPTTINNPDLDTIFPLLNDFVTLNKAVFNYLPRYFISLYRSCLKYAFKIFRYPWSDWQNSTLRSWLRQLGLSPTLEEFISHGSIRTKVSKLPMHTKLCTFK